MRRRCASTRTAGASSPSPASRRPVECPWSVARSHILLDLSELDNIVRCVEVDARACSTTASCTRSSTTPGTSPKGPGGSRLNSLETDIATWQAMYNTNFYAPLLLTRGFAPELSKARGAVVNLTSIAGSRVHPFAGSAYATSKAALAALTRELAFDLAPAGVRVNAIAPGRSTRRSCRRERRRSSSATSRCIGWAPPPKSPT